MARRTMNCREVGLRIQSYLDGELDADKMDGIRDHLEACIECGMEADVFRQIKTDLAEHAPTANASALDRLRAFIRQISRETERAG